MAYVDISPANQKAVKGDPVISEVKCRPVTWIFFVESW
jgi:hypothetical protein